MKMEIILETLAWDIGRMKSINRKVRREGAKIAKKKLRTYTEECRRFHRVAQRKIKKARLSTGSPYVSDVVFINYVVKPIYLTFAWYQCNLH